MFKDMRERLNCDHIQLNLHYSQLLNRLYTTDIVLKTFGKVTVKVDFNTFFFLSDVIKKIIKEKEKLKSNLEKKCPFAESQNITVPRLRLPSHDWHLSLPVKATPRIHYVLIHVRYLTVHCSRK